MTDDIIKTLKLVTETGAFTMPRKDALQIIEALELDRKRISLLLKQRDDLVLVLVNSLERPGYSYDGKSRIDKMNLDLESIK